jgi:hypothetical protein
MKIQIVVFLIVITTFFVLRVNGEEKFRPSLKQLIKESKNQFYNHTIQFDPFEVRKKFEGNEDDFHNAVIDLLNSGDESDCWNVAHIISFLDIRNEKIYKILREKFHALNHNVFLQSRILYAIAAHSCSNENIDFFLSILNHAQSPPAILAQTATLLTTMEYIEEEKKKMILASLIPYLNDEREVRDFVHSYTLGDDIAFSIGNLGDFAKEALPLIQKKYKSAIKNNNNDIFNKLRLACTIVRLNPVLNNEPLKFILQEAMNNESEITRGEAIGMLREFPHNLSKITIPCLYKIIQKESNLENKISATEILKTILLKQQEEMFFLELEQEEKNYNNIGTSKKSALHKKTTRKTLLFNRRKYAKPNF